MPVATCTYGHVLPGAVPAHYKYAAPHSSAIKIAYKPKPETLSQQIVRFMGSRPREKVVVYKHNPSSYDYDYEDGSYPVIINNVSGKRAYARDQMARRERRLSSTERPIVINNRIHGNKRYSYERPSPPPHPVVYAGPEPDRTVSVSPGPSRSPSRSPSYSRPRVHFSDVNEVYPAPSPPSYGRPRVHFSNGLYAPNIIEVTHADDA